MTRAVETCTDCATRTSCHLADLEEVHPHLLGEGCWFFPTSLCGVLTLCSTSAVLPSASRRLLYHNLSVSTCLYQLVSIFNMSLATCLYQHVSSNLSLSTCLYQLVSINMSLSTCLYQHLSINFSLSTCL